jgi:hypothetical protein
MRSKLFVAAALLALCASTGCATYAHDRLKDAVDIVGFKFLAGPGFKLGIGVGAAKTGLNFGYYRFEKVGFQGRAMGIFEETGTEFLAPIDHHLDAVWGNKELFDMVAEFQRIDGVTPRAALFDDALTYPQPRFHTTDGLLIGDIDPIALFPLGLTSLGDFQFTAAAFLGVEFNFSFFQFADFIAGWFGLDPAKDDTRNYTPVGPKEQ